MYRQLFCIFFLFSYLELGLANDNDWNCKNQGEQGWTCGDLIAQKNTDNSLSPVPSKVNKKNLNWNKAYRKNPPFQINRLRLHPEIQAGIVIQEVKMGHGTVV